MKLDTIFDRKDLPEADSFEPIPEGKYIARIKTADVKDTKSGTGQYLNIMWEITKGDNTGRVVFDMINFRNANPKAQEIGLRQLSGLLGAVGIPRLQDTDQLIGYSAEINVKIQTSVGYDPKNIIRSYKALEGSPMPKATSPVEAPAEQKEKAAPWRR